MPTQCVQSQLQTERLRKDLYAYVKLFANAGNVLSVFCYFFRRRAVPVRRLFRSNFEKPLDEVCRRKFPYAFLLRPQRAGPPRAKERTEAYPSEFLQSLMRRLRNTGGEFSGRPSVLGETAGSGTRKKNDGARPAVGGPAEARYCGSKVGPAADLVRARDAPSPCFSARCSSLQVREFRQRFAQRHVLKSKRMIQSKELF